MIMLEVGTPTASKIMRCACACPLTSELASARPDTQGSPQLPGVRASVCMRSVFTRTSEVERGVLQSRMVQVVGHWSCVCKGMHSHSFKREHQVVMRSRLPLLRVPASHRTHPPSIPTTRFFKSFHKSKSCHTSQPLHVAARSRIARFGAGARHSSLLHLRRGGSLG
jgi:hypothetical protein